MRSPDERSVTANICLRSRTAQTCATILSPLRRSYQTYRTDKRNVAFVPNAEVQKCDAIYKKLLDKVTDEDYAMPVLEFPAVLVLDKDLASTAIT